MLYYLRSLRAEERDDRGGEPVRRGCANPWGKPRVLAS